MLVYYHLVFSYASYQCHHCCFLNVGNTHWCSRDNSFFFFWISCSCRCHGHGDEVVEWRVYKGAYPDELCEKEVSATRSSPNHDASPIQSLFVMLLNVFNVFEIWITQRYTSAFGCCLRRDMDDQMDPAADSHFDYARGNNRIANNVSSIQPLLALTWPQPVEHPLYSSWAAESPWYFHDHICHCLWLETYLWYIPCNWSFF